MRIGLAGANSSHAEDFLRAFNSEGRYSPFRLTAVCDADAARVAALRSSFPDLQEFESAEALVGACDAVIVCDRDGRQHRDHALPALQAGKPVFVDKPLAGSVADADVMVEAAAVSGAALLSASALRWQPQVQELRAQFESGSPPHRLLAYGSWQPDSPYGGAIYYAIHTLEVVQELLGTTWERLSVSGGELCTVRYQSGITEVCVELRPMGEGGSDFGLLGEAEDGCFSQALYLPDDYMRPVADRIATMFRTGQSPMRLDQLLAPIRLMAEIAEAL